MQEARDVVACEPLCAAQPIRWSVAHPTSGQKIREWPPPRFGHGVTLPSAHKRDTWLTPLKRTAATSVWSDSPGESDLAWPDAVAWARFVGYPVQGSMIAW